MSRPALGDWLALLLLLLPGCASAATTPIGGRGPEWIDRPNGVFDAGSARVVYAVGSAAESPNLSLQMNQASHRARSELGRSVLVLVQSMVKDYMTTHGDFFAMDTSSSVDYYDDISVQAAEETLFGSMKEDAYRDPIDKTYYVLMRVDFDKVMDSYRAQMQASYGREATRRRIKASAEEFERELDAQLQRFRETDAQELDEALGEG